MADIQQSVSGGASSIKNTISKVGAWAKAHPLPATLIVVVLVVIGWFVYKNSASSSGSASAVVDPNAGGTNLDQSGTGGLTTNAGGDGSSFLPPTPVPPSNIAGVPPAVSPVDYSNFTDTGAITPIPYVDTFTAPVASGSLATGYKGTMDKTRGNSAPQWYDYRDPSTYNLPHNPDGSGRPPKGWIPGIANSGQTVIRPASGSVDISSVPLLASGATGIYNGVTSGGKSGIGAMPATGGAGGSGNKLK